MVLLIVGTYFLFYLPGLIDSFLDYSCQYKVYISNVTLFIFFMKPVINPIIYAAQSRDFNWAYRKLFGLSLTQDGREDSTQVTRTVT